MYRTFMYNAVTPCRQWRQALIKYPSHYTNSVTPLRQYRYGETVSSKNRPLMAAVDYSLADIP